MKKEYKKIVEEDLKGWEEAKQSRINAYKEDSKTYPREQLEADIARDNRIIEALKSLLAEVDDKKCPYAPKDKIFNTASEGQDFCINQINRLKQDLTQERKEIERLKKQVYQHEGGEDDGYDGKTSPITWKEAYEEEERYMVRMLKEMDEACKKIKAHPDWKYGENAYPSPHERAIVAGCQRAVKELQAELNRIKGISVEGLGKIEDTLAQPPDRISEITIESYSKIRQKVLREATAIKNKIEGEK